MIANTGLDVQPMNSKILTCLVFLKFKNTKYQLEYWMWNHSPDNIHPILTIPIFTIPSLHYFYPHTANPSQTNTVPSYPKTCQLLPYHPCSILSKAHLLLLYNYCTILILLYSQFWKISSKTLKFSHNVLFIACEYTGALRFSIAL